MGDVAPTAVIGSYPQDRVWLAAAKLAWVECFAPVIDPTARVGALTVIDAGTVRATSIGARTWIMCQVHIGHDVVIGANCEVAPMTAICGHAEIGDGVRIGVGACILPYRKIGVGARIGAGAVVICDVPAGEVWVGNPARRMGTA